MRLPLLLQAVKLKLPRNLIDPDKKNDFAIDAGVTGWALFQPPCQPRAASSLSAAAISASRPLTTC